MKLGHASIEYMAFTIIKRAKLGTLSLRNELNPVDSCYLTVLTVLNKWLNDAVLSMAVVLLVCHGLRKGSSTPLSLF